MLNGDYKVSDEILDELRDLFSQLQLDDSVPLVKRFKAKAQSDDIKIEHVADIMCREIELFLEKQEDRSAGDSIHDDLDNLEMENLKLA